MMRIGEVAETMFMKCSAASRGNFVERRLRDAFGTDAKFETIGVPKAISAARDLALRDKHEFEKWAITLLPDAQPFRGGRKGADTGIDGIVYLRTAKSQTDKAIVEVKGGGKRIIEP